MDRIDRLILRELQRDGRLSNAELAERVNLTESPCLRRLRRLERAGLITGYRALLDGHALRCGFEVFVSITMRREDHETIMDFEGQLAERREIIEAHRLFGDPDYLLRVAVADITAYQHFYTDVLARLTGVEKMTSHLTMKQVKVNRGFPVDVKGS